MSYIPQYVNVQDNALTLTCPPGYSSWRILNPGTGYTSADVGQTLTKAGGSFGRVGTTTITAVSGGGITGLAESVCSGWYPGGNGLGGNTTIGGSGTGCTVQTGSTYVGFYTENVGLGASFTQLTFYANVFTYVFLPTLNLEGYAGGITLRFMNQTNLYDVDENCTINFLDTNGIGIFSGKFVPPQPRTTTATMPTSFYDVLLSLDTSAQTIHVFINDVEWVLAEGSGLPGWMSSNAITNPYGAMSGWKILGAAGGLASLYMTPTYTDFTVSTNRRMFTTNTDGTWVDPATFPPGAVNLYLRQGDNPGDLGINHGTGGAWITVSTDMEFMYFMNYWTSAFTHIDKNASFTHHIPGGTVRPGGSAHVKVSGANHGTLAISGENYTYTPPVDYVGYDGASFGIDETMPAGYVQPFFAHGSTSINEGISVGTPPIPETNRNPSLALHTLQYRAGFSDVGDFVFPSRFYDRSVVVTVAEKNYDDTSEVSNWFWTHLAITVEELGPTSSTQTTWGVRSPDAGVDYLAWGVWGNRFVNFVYDTSGDIFAYYYLEYVPGATTTDTPTYTTGSLADLGLSTRIFDCVFPIAWQGLTSAFLLALDPHTDNANAYDALVVSEQGVQVILNFLTMPSGADPYAIIPDLANNCNWIISFNTDSPDSVMYGQCMSSTDGSIISEKYYMLEAGDACSNLFYGLVTWGASNNFYQLSSTPDYFRVYGGMGWWGGQSDESKEFPKGDFVVSIAKDFSGYTVDYLVPKSGDTHAFFELNNNEPSGYVVHDRDGIPYYMGWGETNADFGIVLSSIVTVYHPIFKMVSLYPFDAPTSEYFLTAGSDFDPNASQYSISLWCCKDVHIQSPNLAIVTTMGPPGFHTLPVVGNNTSYDMGAYAVSADGHTTAGYVRNPTTDASVACYWIDLYGPVIIGPDGSQADAVSGDGSVIVGGTQVNVGGNTYKTQPFRWTEASGAVLFGLAGDFTSAISADASRIVGATQNGTNADWQPCFWDSSLARTDLGPLSGYPGSSVATDVSADGTVIVGHTMGVDFAHSVNTTQRAWRWTAADGMIDLGVAGGATEARAFGVSGNGAVVVGDLRGVCAFRWTQAGGMVMIPEVGVFYDASYDGSTIAGQVYSGPNDTDQHFAYMTASRVTVPTPVALDSANPGTIQGTNPMGISDDGKTIVGYSYVNSPGLYGPPWVYYMPPPSSRPALTMDFSPSQIAISLYSLDGSLRFSGTWTVASPTDKYQVLFSIDTYAQTYTLYVNDTVPIGAPTWGDPGPIGWA